MTDLKQAAQQALEALIDAANVLSAPMFADAADALREALAQPVQEPVAWWDKVNDLVTTDKHVAATRLKNFGSSHAIALVVQDTTPPLPEQEPVKLQEPVISAWSLREVYFDEDGEPSMHRSPPAAPEQEPPQYSLKAHWTDDKRIGVVACMVRPDGGVHVIQTIIDPPLPVQPQRPWQGLTDEEMSKCNFDADEHMVDREIAKRNVQAMLKERNHG